MKRFDEQVYFLGDLCRRSHDFEESGKSIRYQSTKRCVFCQKVNSGTYDTGFPIKPVCDDGAKWCSGCEQCQPISEFYSSGKSHHCRICCLQKYHENYIPKPPRYQSSREGYRVCSVCGEKPESEFYSNGRGGLSRRCNVCIKAHVKEYSLRNSVALRLKRKEYRRNITPEQRDRMHDQQRAHRQTEGFKERRRRWLSVNRESILNNMREYARENRSYLNLYSSERRARLRQFPNNFKRHHWQRAMSYFGHCCAACGRPAGLWHTIAADHWIPLVSPNCPGTVPSNMIPLCHPKRDGEGGCNAQKHDRDPIVWLTEKFGRRKADQILKRINAYFEWVVSIESEGDFK